MSLCSYGLHACWGTHSDPFQSDYTQTDRKLYLMLTPPTVEKHYGYKNELKRKLTRMIEWMIIVQMSAWLYS
jgi:hypothetical protein